MKTTKYRTKLKLQDLLGLQVKEVLELDCSNFYINEFKCWLNYIRFTHPNNIPDIVERFYKTYVTYFKTTSTRSYFRKLKSQIVFAKKTLWHLNRGDDCAHKCRKCPLKKCVRGGGKGKQQKLVNWLATLDL